MAIQESGEMYLETILILSQKNIMVRAVDICGYMGFSKPSVSRALGNLKKDALVTVDCRGSLVLTEAGRMIAERIYERHSILTRLLMMLGVSEDTARRDACKMEHDISDETFEMMKRHADAYRDNAV